jgi:hypothetical protein
MRLEQHADTPLRRYVSPIAHPPIRIPGVPYRLNNQLKSVRTMLTRTQVTTGK